MYSVEAVLARFAENQAWILVFAAIAWGTGLVQIVEGLRLGFRDRVPAAPIGMTTFLIAHDGTYFLWRDHWFGTVDHWFFELMWYGMGPCVLIELVMVWQFIRYGRPRIAPQLSPWQFAGIWLLFQAFTIALFWWLHSLIDDPLYLVSLVGSQIAAVIFLVPFALSRRDAAGQSPAFVWATLLGPGSLALGLFPALSPIFHTPLYAALCVLLFALSVVYLLLYERLRTADAGLS